MSSIINKVKDVLHSDKDKTTTHDTTTHGSHTHEPRVDPERDTRTSALHSSTAGNTGSYSTSDNYAAGAVGTTGHSNFTTGPASHTAGPHSSNAANKADPRIDSDMSNVNRAGAVGSGPGPAPNTAGPHSSDLLNKADPRVDSDRDSHNRVGGYGSGPGPASNTAGPHSSNIANKADPRVDSDLDSSRTGFNNTHSSTHPIGTTGSTVGSHAIHGQQYNTPGAHTGVTGTTGTTHSGLNTTATGVNTTTGVAGSGFNSGNTMGTTSHNTHGVHGTHGTHGVHGTTGTHGTTGSGLGNTHTGTTHTGTSHGAGNVTGLEATGPAPNTAGPHKSDLLNKVDPRVDSDLDGSKTVGGNNTGGRKDPTDAAQVPPSVLQRHIGPPVVHHDDASHDRERRHSIHNRETHSGL